MKDERRTLAARVRNLVFMALASILLFVLVEGLASSLLVTGEVVAGVPELAERRHTRYDPELGWANVPGVEIPDMYGPGSELVVNEQGFRDRQHFPRAVPEGKLRVVCSGDSFTFGYGVANDESWCQRLAELDPRLETVNMGQGGYGVDQAYLWYRRDSSRIEHDLHVFALVRVDFERMRHDRFLGYNKPVLRFQDGELVAGNVPVPRQSEALLRWRRRLGPVRELRIFELLRRLAGGGRPEASVEPDEHLVRLALGVFDDLQRINARAGRRFVVVFLPMKADYQGTRADAWRRLVGDHARESGYVFVDLVEYFRGLPPARIESFFIPEGALAYASAAGHYTVRGNEVVARALYEKVRDFGVL